MKKSMFLLLFLYGVAFGQDVRISEIMYNPPESGTDSLEFLELYNASDHVVDMSGWYFSEGIVYDFDNVQIAAGDFLVLAKDSAAFARSFALSVIEWESGSLSNSGELLLLKNALGETVDSLVYAASSLWPDAAKGLGAALVRCDFSQSDPGPASWQASADFMMVNAAGDSLWASPLAADAVCQPPQLASFTHFPESAAVDVSPNVLIRLSFAIPLQLPGEAEGDFAALEDYFELTKIGEDTLRLDFDLVVKEGAQELELRPLSPLDEAGEYRMRIFAGLLDMDDRSLGDYEWSFTVASPQLGSKDIVITEIMYNSPESGADSLEFIELYNKGVASVSLGGWYFEDGISFVFSDAVLAPKEYFLIAVDSVAFENFYGLPAFQWTAGSLSNEGELISLYNADGVLIDSVRYDNDLPWTVQAGGGGSSLVFCDYSLDNALAQNWFACYDLVNCNANYDLVYANPGTRCNEVIGEETEEGGLELSAIAYQEDDFVDLQWTDGAVRVESSLPLYMSLMTIDGKLLTTQWLLPGGNECALSAYKNGVYILLLREEKGRFFRAEKILLNN